MRTDNIDMLLDTLKVLRRGWYKKDGRKTKLKLSSTDMKSAIVLLPGDVDEIENDKNFNVCVNGDGCTYSCVNVDSFTQAMALNNDIILQDGDTEEVLVLNFANPVHPGGGVRKGARAQEEDLCRKSSLLLSLESYEADRYYTYNKSLETFMGSNAIIISPKVEIIKDRNRELLDDTVVVSVMTCAAPMITYGLEGMSESEYEDMVHNRIVKMLKCAAYYGYKYLVLGAWGCGAFENDARVISDLFYKALKNIEYNGMRGKDLFRRIDFAVLDNTDDQYNFMEFYRNFGQ